MESDITLILPESEFLQDQRAFPNLGVLYLSSSLAKRGYKTDILDMSLDKDLDSINTDIVGISATSPNIKQAAKIAAYLKSKGHRYVILGGCGSGSVGEYRDVFDIIMRGECEHRLPDLMDVLIDSTNNKVERIKQIEKLLSVPDIDTIPFPDRSLLKDYNYKIEGRKTATMITSRGCCFSCAFCEEGKSSNLRVRKVDNVIQEIDEVEKLGYKAIMFFDDIFTSNAKRLETVGKYLLDKDIFYRCFTHVKFAHKAAKALADTGCKEVGIGIESADDDILRSTRKGFTSSEATKAIKILQDHGLKVKVFLMVGLPGESKDTIDKMWRWYDTTRPDLYSLSIYSPFPGTEIYENKTNFDINWCEDSTHFYDAKVWTSQLTRQDLQLAKQSFDNQYGA